MSKMTKAVVALSVVAGLGVAALPLSSYAASSNPATVDLYAQVTGNVSMTVDDEEINFGGLDATNDVVSKSTTITVTTNNSNGYKIEMTDSDNNTDMVQVDGNGYPLNGGASIPTGNLEAAASGWGYSMDNGTSYNAVPALNGTPAEIKNVPNADDSGKPVTVTFGIKTNNQAEGTYKGSVVFTATANE